MPSEFYALMGHPLKHSLSPKLYALFNKQTKAFPHFLYKTLACTLPAFPQTLQAFLHSGGKSCNITQPVKEAAYTLADIASPAAKQAQAANLLIYKKPGALYADNTDGKGLLVDLYQNMHYSVEKKHILIIGAGGAARGIIGPLLAQSPASLWITNRTRSTAYAVQAHFNNKMQVVPLHTDPHTLPSYNLIINATSAHCNHAALVLPHLRLSPKALCYDVNYQKGLTPFLHYTRTLGVQHTQDGLGMLIEQAACAFSLWTGEIVNTSPFIQNRSLLL